MRLFVTVSLHEINEDNLNERDDYGVPFSEQQYMHSYCYISLFNNKSFHQSDPLEWPQILDIRDLKQHDVVMRRRWSLAKFLFKFEQLSVKHESI